MIDLTEVMQKTSSIRDTSQFVTTFYNKELRDTLMWSLKTNAKMSEQISFIDILNGNFEIVFDYSQCVLFPATEKGRCWLANVTGFILSLSYEDGAEYSPRVFITFCISDICKFTKEEVYRLGE